MGRHTGPKGKLVRRFEANIFGNPKFDRLLAKQESAPRQFRGNRRGRNRTSDYGLQLVEKQKLKYTYGMRERQFRKLFGRALRQPGITAENMLILLEARLDNVVFRMGLAPSRDAARQLVGHGHVRVQGRRVNIPSFEISEGDEITSKESTRSQTLIRRNLEESASREVPPWLEVDADNLAGKVVRLPLRQEIDSVANEQLVVALYSK